MATKKGLLSSPKTTIAAILAFLVILFTQLNNLLDTDPQTAFNAEAVLSAFLMMLTGIFARDNSKSSEQVGAKEETKPAPPNARPYPGR